MIADAVRRAVEEGKLIAILRLDDLEQAESLVRALLDAAATLPRKRIATQPTRASRERRLAEKARTGAIKSGRGRAPPE